MKKNRLKELEERLENLIQKQNDCLPARGKHYYYYDVAEVNRLTRKIDKTKIKINQEKQKL